MNHFHYREGHLYVEDVSLQEIADAVKTPCYIYSKAALKQNWLEFSQGLQGHDAQIFYAVKSNSNLAVINLMARLGSGFDIVSGGELERVIRGKGDPTQTIFSGVGKSEAEIKFALQSEVFSLNIESESELERIQSIARETGHIARISVRVNPDVDANTHPHISTGLKENKFGVPFDRAREIFRKATLDEHLEIIGIAVHIGSQITSMDPIVTALDRIIDLAQELINEGIEIQHLDLGGGLGVSYREETPPQISEYCSAICDVLDRRSFNLGISIEPGRSITANAGVLLTKVEYIKENDSKSFAVVDGAMNDLLRPALYDAWMQIKPVSVKSELKPTIYDVVGPICESGDFLGKNRKLSIEAGDLIAICDAGAYGAVMASNYNTRPKPPEVMVSKNQYEVVRRRESIEEMLALESVTQI